MASLIRKRKNKQDINKEKKSESMSIATDTKEIVELIKEISVQLNTNKLKILN